VRNDPGLHCRAKSAGRDRRGEIGRARTQWFEAVLSGAKLPVRFLVAGVSLCYHDDDSSIWSGVLPPRFSVIFSLFCTVLLALVIAAAYSLSVTSANGRAQLILSQEQGPYQIDVSILPGQAVVANTHVSILILSLTNGQPITEAVVSLSGSGPEGSTAFGPIPATNDFIPQFFETALPFDLAGDWELTVAVASGLGEVAIVVPMNVREGGGAINWILMSALVVVVVTVGVWTWDRVSSRKQPVGRG
jgi:hypothetical protein